jgi:hypothetical protein
MQTSAITAQVESSRYARCIEVMIGASMPDGYVLTSEPNALLTLI